MRITGIIIQDTLQHVDDEDLKGCSKVYGEPYYLKKFKDANHAYSRLEFIPMISGYLGSKTQITKKEEIEFIESGAANGVLYYFDSKNIKFNEPELFREEIFHASRILSKKKSVLYLPVDYYNQDELSLILSLIKKFSCKVMIYFEEFSCNKANFFNAVETVKKAAGPERLICAFPDKNLYEKMFIYIEALGLKEAAYYG